MAQLKSQKTKRIYLFKEQIYKVLENRGDYADEAWWEDEETQEELNKLASAEEDYVSNSECLKIESREKLIFAVYKNNREALFNQIIEQICSMASNLGIDGIHLIFFVQGMRDRIQLEKSYSAKFKDQIRSEIRKATGKNNLVLQDTYVLIREYAEREIRITDVKRFEVLQMPPMSTEINRESAGKSTRNNAERESLYGRVFNADLIQLVEIYDIIGDQLFRNNVRLGISEMMGVDRAICETLEKEPEHFWYKNNGITILIQSSEINPTTFETFLLGRIIPEKQPTFSVINGAQTITASARYFFEMEFKLKDSVDISVKERLKKKLEDSKKAQVLVRVIHIPEFDKFTSRNMATEISVALNRQKPVKMEDIAFTTPFVEKLVVYLERGMREGKADFWLVRRGDRSFKDKQMELISFVRARKASMGEPGEARSQDANTLLKVQVDHEGNYFFQQKDIFVEEWMEANENQEEEVFKRFYGAVWFADRLAQRYEQLKKQFKEENFDILTVIRNGKWYFTATLVQLLNDFSSCKNGDGSIIPDFSKFHGALEDIEENLSKGILCFAKILVHIALKRSYGKLDSNFFKKSECYHDLIQNLQQVWELDKSAQIENFEGKDMEEVRLTELFREFISLFNKNELDRKGLLESGIKGDYIKLGIDQITIDSIADAMEKTVGYILKQYPQCLLAGNFVQYNS